MNSRISFAALLLSVAFLPLWPFQTVSQTTMSGGRGLFRVQSAETIGLQNFYVNAYFLTFLTKQEKSSLTKDHTLNLALTYGLSDALELMAKLVPYQDDQKHIWGPPGDTEVGLKWRTPLSGSGVYTGFLGFFSFPTSTMANVPYEPYSSDKIAWGAKALVTFDLSGISPVVPMKFSVNVGYMDHDMSDRYFNGEPDQLLLGAGFKLPVRSVIFYSEFSGEYFFKSRTGIAFNENSMRISPGIKFMGPFRIIFDIAGDVGLSKDPRPGDLRKYAKDYADWKIVFGGTMNFSLRPHFVNKRQLAAKRREAEAEKMDRDRIRSRREKAAEELEKIRKLLEGEGDSETSKP